MTQSLVPRQVQIDKNASHLTNLAGLLTVPARQSTPVNFRSDRFTTFFKEWSREMQDLFRDPVWQFWGAVFGFLAILTTIAIAGATLWYQRRSKNLSCELVSSGRLVGITSKVGLIGGRLKLKMYLDDKQITNAQLLILRFRNSGNIPITPSDYVEPVSVVFPEGTRILDAYVGAVSPANLRVTTQVVQHRAVMEKILLNKGDSVTLQIILEGDDTSFHVEGRIIGIKEIAGYFESKNMSLIWSRNFFALIAFMVLGLGLGLAADIDFWFLLITLGIGGLVISVALSVLESSVTRFNRNYRRRNR